MDILSLITTSIPGYFVLGPLGVVLVILIVLLAKKDKPGVVSALPIETPVAPPLAPSAPVIPVVEVTPAQSQEGWKSIPQETPVSQQVPVTTSPTNPTTTEGVIPVVPTEPLQVSEMPKQPELVMNHPASPVPPASIPPISSWKPTEQSVTVSSDMIGESEAELQAHAVNQESVASVITQESVQVAAEDKAVPEKEVAPQAAPVSVV